LFHRLLHSHRDPPPLHSFPTRRSSDLAELANRHSGSGAQRDESPIRGGEVDAVVPRRNTAVGEISEAGARRHLCVETPLHVSGQDRKSTRLNSSHRTISYAVFCLKKKN